MNGVPSPKFGSEINWGHILQAVVILVTVGGGTITAYVSLRSDADKQYSELRSSSDKQYGLTLATLAELKGRIDALDARETERQAENREIRDEIKETQHIIMDAQLKAAGRK
jgi:hypothetical protein